MQDHDLENQVNVAMNDAMYADVVNASDNLGSFKGRIVRACVARCIRQDRAPKWKRFIVKLIKY